MNDFFAHLFEIGTLFHGVFSLELLMNGVYSKLGFTVIGIPLVFMLLFYLLWRYPYSKFYHWLIWLALSCILVAFVSYAILEKNLAQFLFSKSEYPGISGFVRRIVIVSGIYGLITGLGYSILLKQIPTAQSHLPYAINKK